MVFWWLVLLCLLSGRAGGALSCDSSTPIICTQKEKYAAPPINVPHHLRDCFTRCGSIPIESYFVDDSFGGQGSHYVFKRPQLDAMIAAAARTPVAARRDKLRWAVAAIMSLDLTGKRVIVFGSTAPRFEALCLARGAATVVTVEHNQLTYEHPQLQTMTVAQFELQQDSLAGTFDIALSVSSFDHDGLGRYGDPVCPDADFVSMRALLKLLSPNKGMLVLSVPVSIDLVVWNLHRVYGPIRLPLLLQGWKQHAAFGWSDASFAAVPNARTDSPEPAFILTPSPEHAEL